MKYFHVRQGSPEWLRLRLAMPTASNFEKIIQPKQWSPTKGETRLNFQMFLLAELILDAPLSTVTTAAMDHGTEYEENSRLLYEMMTGQEVKECGFITNDAMTYGASPDGFVGDEGSIELKNPIRPDVHVSYLMNPRSLVDAYWVQTQGQLLVTKRKWTDLVSNFRGLPLVDVRVEPHPEFQEKLAAALDSFCEEFRLLVERATELGYVKKRDRLEGWKDNGNGEYVHGYDPLGISAEDEELILADIRRRREARTDHS